MNKLHFQFATHNNQSQIVLSQNHMTSEVISYLNHTMCDVTVSYLSHAMIGVVMEAVFDVNKGWFSLATGSESES